MNLRRKLSYSSFFIASLISASAWSVVVPPTAQPERRQQELSITPERPAVGGESVITVPDEKGHSKPLKGEATFVLKGIKFKNLTAFSEQEMIPTYSEYVGKKVSLSTVNQIADKITAKYRNAGYILSRATVPPQRIEDGMVEIRIIEGFVNNVTIEGVKGNSGLLAEYADKIRNAKPLDAATLERYLLLMQDLPGVSARAVLEPAPGVTGGSNVVITVTQKQFDGALTADNRGTRYLGPFEGGMVVGANNMLGLYDRTQLHGVLTANPDELQFFQISHDEQLDSEGTKLTLSAGRTRTKPDYRLKVADVVGTDTIYSATISHPFIRSRQTNLFGNADFDIRNTDNSVLGIPNYGDRLRVGRIGGSYDFVDVFTAVNRFDTQLSKGFGWDDDTSPHIRSRINGRTSFWKETFNASRLQPIDGPFGFYLAATGQAASDELLSAEQFGLGGANFGSAYDPSEITGDSGIAGRAELQYSRAGDFKLIPSYQLYTFYDIGAVWTRNPSPGIDKIDSLASAGVGVRFNIMEPLSGDLEVALPLTRPVAANRPSDGNAARVFFSLAARY